MINTAKESLKARSLFPHFSFYEQLKFHAQQSSVYVGFVVIDVNSAEVVRTTCELLKKIFKHCQLMLFFCYSIILLIKAVTP